MPVLEGRQSPVRSQARRGHSASSIGAAKLAQSPELAGVRQPKLERCNPNGATLAVARKIVCYLLAAERRTATRQDAEQKQPCQVGSDAEPIRVELIWLIHRHARVIILKCPSP